jgi:hypothetical protein
MKKEFISYEQALALKELGFDEPCLGFYNHQGILILMNQEDELNIEVYKNSYVKLGKQYAAPLRQQAFRWFREKYGLWQIVMQNTDKDWTYDIMPIIGMIDYKIFDVFDTYEEAELACLIKLIEIVKTK